jgi:hypothetical protein
VIDALLGEELTLLALDAFKITERRSGLSVALAVL